MEKNAAVAMVMYINKAMGIVPTTGVEWSQLQSILVLLEGVANGRVTVDVRPVSQENDGATAEVAGK